MKTFIALTFIGILTGAYAKFVDKCTTPAKVMDNFAAPKFHTGTWYVTHVKYLTTPTECRTLSTSQVGDKSIVEHDYTNNRKLRCEALAEKEKRLTFNCTSGGETIDKTIFIAMETDFDNYALYYICSTLTSGPDKGKTSENYLVASRKSGKEEIPVQLKSLTQGMQLNKCN